MRLGSSALAIALCGCSAQISDARDPSVGNVDPMPDAGAGGVAACASRTVFLNFDGQTLTRGPSDATLDQASWMTITVGAAPPYQAGTSGRSAAIQSITDGVRGQLSQFPIKVTTSRPGSGNYVMIVFGGDASLVGSNFGGAVNQLDCGDVRPNDVAWISDNVTGQRAINTAIGAIGFGLGLTATTDPRDCMCSWDNSCRPNNSLPCRLGSPIDRDSTARQLCPGLTTQDEIATFRAAFCGTR
ncbi:MAG TPA: hypothetical protein VIX73_14870 [Kofleriaceae bacterium]|jgi:hypothetical protein